MHKELGQRLNAKLFLVTVTVFFFAFITLYLVYSHFIRTEFYEKLLQYYDQACSDIDTNLQYVEETVDLFVFRYHIAESAESAQYELSLQDTLRTLSQTHPFISNVWLLCSNGLEYFYDNPSRYVFGDLKDNPTFQSAIAANRSWFLLSQNKPQDSATQLLYVRAIHHTGQQPSAYLLISINIEAIVRELFLQKDNPYSSSSGVVLCNGQNQQPFLLFSREGSGNGEKLQQYIQKNPKPVLTPGYAMDYNLLADGDLAIGLYHPLDSIKQKTMLLALMLIAAFFLFVSLGAVIIRMITRNITLQLDLLYQKINAYFKEENPHVDNPHR